VLSPTWSTVRLFLHVLAATVWVGGQIVLAGLVPGLRRLSPDAPRAAARRFNLLAWPAFAVLVVTGVWNLLAVDVGDTSLEYQVTLGVKIAVVALSGVAAAVHSGARSKIVLAVGGAVSGLAALVAVFLGVLLASGG
jgi:putative copper export protein